MAASVPMRTDPSVPAAQGTVMATETDNKNLEVAVKVDHLAPAEKIENGATTYVVWAKGEGGKPQNLGALQVDDDLSGSLTTVTPMRRFEVFITPEKQPDAMSPSGKRVMGTQINR